MSVPSYQQTHGRWLNYITNPVGLGALVQTATRIGQVVDYKGFSKGMLQLTFTAAAGGSSWVLYGGIAPAGGVWTPPLRVLLATGTFTGTASYVVMSWSDVFANLAVDDAGQPMDAQPVFCGAPCIYFEVSCPAGSTNALSIDGGILSITQ